MERKEGKGALAAVGIMHDVLDIGGTGGLRRRVPEYYPGRYGGMRGRRPPRGNWVGGWGAGRKWQTGQRQVAEGSISEGVRGGRIGLQGVEKQRGPRWGEEKERRDRRARKVICHVEK